MSNYNTSKFNSKYFEMPKLPSSVVIPESDGMAACPWLDDYIAFSKKWAPRAFEDFHEAIGLWVLSTVAARRVCTNLGKRRYPHLYIALVARTSVYTKSSATEIGIQAIHQANLAYLLSADSSTPQRLLYDMGNVKPDGLSKLNQIEQSDEEYRIAMRGQKGWYRGDAGQLIREIMKSGGTMSEYRGMLSELDDAPESFRHNTFHTGKITVNWPYLTILFNLTPKDLAPFAKVNSDLWRDGFLARFALITPPEGNTSRARFPKGQRVIPDSIIKPLIDWNSRLGTPPPQINFLDKQNPKMTNMAPFPQRELELSEEVEDAFYGYHDGLLDLLPQTSDDLAGNYARLPEKTIRMAVLFADLEGSPKIKYVHWARAQAIAERCRAGLHQLYLQVNSPPPSSDADFEDKLVGTVRKLGSATAADVSRYFNGSSSKEIGISLDKLIETGILSSEQYTQKGTRYYKAREVEKDGGYQ